MNEYDVHLRAAIRLFHGSRSHGFRYKVAHFHINFDDEIRRKSFRISSI